MAHRLFSSNWWRLGVRPFRDRELEHEFQAAFRSAGVRFFEICAVLGGFAYFAFFLIYLGNSTVEPLSQPQPLRLLMTVCLLGAAATGRFAKPFLIRHYEAICLGVVGTSIVCTSIIGGLVVSIESPYSRYWAIYSSAVFVSLVVYGFTRVPILSTLFLAALNVGISIWFAIDFGADAKVVQRMAVHLVSVNILAFALYQLINLRERKLFLRAKRQRSIGQLTRARDKAEEASRAKSAFLANMSHEIRTPMNGIIGSLALIEQADSEDRRRTLVNVAREAADGLLQTLNEILDYAKLDAKKGTLRIGAVDVRRVCRVAVQTFQANAAAKSIGLLFDSSTCPADLAFVMGDEEKLRRVVMNLVSNAIKFTAVGGVTLRLRCSRVADGIKLSISVADSGLGIPADKLPMLFEPFFQVDAGMSRTFGGTGLGLAISRQLVEVMGGTVRVKSVGGRGSVFAVRLVLQEAFERPEAARIAPEALPHGLDAVRGKTVLLVEDNAVNAFISAASLESMGVASVRAGNGREAVDLYRQRRFDAVLMDCEMPVMDGLAATRLIREIEIRTGIPRTPIIALTANALTGDREHCLAQGMDDYLSKPIDLHRLAVLVAKWLGCEAVVNQERSDAAIVTASDAAAIRGA